MVPELREKDEEQSRATDARNKILGVALIGC